MAKITLSLNEMFFYAFHGYYEFEKRVGNEFVLNVEVVFDLNDNPGDKIENTINYEDIYDICLIYMKKNYCLLESLLYDICFEIKTNFIQVQKVKVQLKKLNPPLAGKVGSAMVTIEL